MLRCVTTGRDGDDLPAAKVVGERTHPRGQLSKVGQGQAQADQRIGAMTVRADNDEDDLRPVGRDRWHYPAVEGALVGCAIRSPFEWNVEIEAKPLAPTGGIRGTSAGIKPTTKSVHGHRENWLVEKDCLGTVAVMAVQIDNSDPFDATFLLEETDRDRDVVERTKTGDPVAVGVVEAAGRVESAASRAVGDQLSCQKRSPNRKTRPAQHARPGRRIAVVEVAGSTGIGRDQIGEVLGGVNAEDILVGRFRWPDFNQWKGWVVSVRRRGRQQPEVVKKPATELIPPPGVG